MPTLLPNHADRASVALVFPPLVVTNFGSYYPSLAVLAARLHADGTDVRQFDLNEDLVDELYRDASWLDRLTGVAEETGADALTRAAIRLLFRNRDAVVTADGRHRASRDAAGGSRLLTKALEPLRMDGALDVLLAGGAGSSRAAFYAAFYERVLPDIEQLRPALLGLSVPMGPQLGPTIVLLRMLAGRLPETRTVLGGPTFSLMDERSIEQFFAAVPNVDAIVRYDGEETLSAMVRQIAAGTWDPGILGNVSYRGPGGAIVHRAPQPGPPLAKLPTPLYDPALLARLDDPELGVAQARGCYWGRCAYCDFIELYEGSGRYRSQLPVKLVDQMEELARRHGIRRFSLITESLPAVFALRMAREIVARGLEIRWTSFAMVDERFTEEVFAAMAASGCEYLVIGAESMTDRVLELVHKAGRAEMNRAFFRRGKASGIAMIVNLIPDLPSTTYEESLESLEGFRELADCFRTISVFPFEPTKSSSIGRDPEAFGLTIDDAATIGQSQFASNHLAVRDLAMTDEQREDAYQRYYAFAREVNRATAGDTVVRRADENEVVHVSERAIDIWRDGVTGEAVIYDWRRDECLIVPDALASFTASIMRRPPERLGTLMAAGGGRGRRYAEALLQHGILRPVEAAQLRDAGELVRA